MFTKSSAIGITLASAGMACALSAEAGTARIEVELPRLQVGAYHRPYVAGWIEDANGQSVGTAFVWYEVRRPEGGGEKWLKDIRTWWRKAGRALASPPDAVSGPTRAPGRQVVNLDTRSGVFKGLAAGSYTLMVEASREEGGREVVAVPFTWAPNKAANAAGSGSVELGQVSISVTP